MESRPRNNTLYAHKKANHQKASLYHTMDSFKSTNSMEGFLRYLALEEAQRCAGAYEEFEKTLSKTSTRTSPTTSSSCDCSYQPTIGTNNAAKDIVLTSTMSADLLNPPTSSEEAEVNHEGEPTRRARLVSIQDPRDDSNFALPPKRKRRLGERNGTQTNRTQTDHRFQTSTRQQCSAYETFTDYNSSIDQRGNEQHRSISLDVDTHVIEEMEFLRSERQVRKLSDDCSDISWEESIYMERNECEVPKQREAKGACSPFDRTRKLFRKLSFRKHPPSADKLAKAGTKLDNTKCLAKEVAPRNHLVVFYNEEECMQYHCEQYVDDEEDFDAVMLEWQSHPVSEGCVLFEI